MKEGTDVLMDAVRSLGDLIEIGTRLGKDLLNLVDSGRASMAGNRLYSSTPRGGSCCSIPPACWEPLSAGEVTCHVCPGSSATIRIRITNCAAHAHKYSVEAAGKPAVTISPASFTLGPLERGIVAISVAVPANASLGQEDEYLIFIRGCRVHYIRWTVKAASRGADCCHEIDIDDCADTIHHWYDHFYCQHACQHRVGA